MHHLVSLKRFSFYRGSSESRARVVLEKQGCCIFDCVDVLNCEVCIQRGGGEETKEVGWVRNRVLDA